MSKPVFVLLHGAWHSPACWSRLTPLLSQHGYETVCPALPTSGANPPLPDWSADVDVIRSTVSELVEERDVVVVMHSFSGMTGGTALEGLDKASCGARGLKGGVVRLVYVMAFIVPEGFQHSKPGTRDNMVEEMKTDLEAGTVSVSAADAKGLFYQDLSDAEVAVLYQDIRPHSLAAFWSTTTHAAWRHIPTTYVVCAGDKPSTVVAAEWLVETAKQSGPHRIEKVVKHPVGHSPFISQPEWLVGVLREAAGEEMEAKESVA